MLYTGSKWSAIGGGHYLHAIIFEQDGKAYTICGEEAPIRGPGVRPRPGAADLSRRFAHRLVKWRDPGPGDATQRFGFRACGERFG